MGTQVERIVLYVVVLALAVAVGYLASEINGGGCASCSELGGRLTDIETTIDGLEKNVDAVKEIASGVGASISAHDGRTATTLDGIDAAVASGIKDGLTGLEDRIVAALAKLQVTECPPIEKGDECVKATTPPGPTPGPSGGHDGGPRPPGSDGSSSGGMVNSKCGGGCDFAT